MSDVILSNIKSSGELLRLAPDLTALETSSLTNNYITETIAMVAGVEKEILALSGKHAVSTLYLSGLVNESMRLRMLNDGTEIWDSTVNVAGGAWAVYNNISSALAEKPAFKINSSLSLLLTTTTDLSINIHYTAVKML